MSILGIPIEKESVCVFNGIISKYEALDALIDAVAGHTAVTNREAFRRALFERESIMSTGIGGGVAIPHVRIEEVLRPIIGVGVSPEGIEYDTLDNKPVYIIVLFAMPAGSHKEYLGLLAQVMQSLKKPDFQNRLMACRTPEEVVVVANSEE